MCVCVKNTGRESSLIFVCILISQLVPGSPFLSSNKATYPAVFVSFLDLKLCL